MTYLCQAPKEYKAQSATWRKANPSLDDLVEQGYLVYPKYDGCCVVINTTTRGATSRTGTAVKSLDRQVDILCDKVGPGWVLFGEAWIPNTPFAEISGYFRQHKESLNLRIVLWDAHRLGGDDRGFYTRFTDATRNLDGTGWVIQKAKVIGLQGSVEDTARLYGNRQGFDGIILRDPGSLWSSGSAKNGEVIKVKPRLSLDLQVLGWFPGEGKHLGRAGGITVTYQGVTSDVGTGFTDKARRAIADGDYHAVAEIECLGITDAGKLREPSFKGWRFDKDKAD